MSPRGTRKPGRPRDPIPRSQFLDAAAALFAAHGYGGTSMGAIARAVDVSKSVLFHHFANKEDLYVAILADATDDLLAMVLVALQGEDGFLPKLDRLGETLVRYLGARPAAAHLLVRELVSDGPYLSGAGRPHVEHTLDATVAFLASGMREGTIPTRDPRQLAGSIIGLHLLWFASTGLTSHLVGGDPSAAEAIETRVREVRAHVRSLCGAPVDPDPAA